MITHPATIEEYPFEPTPDGVAFLRQLKSRELRVLAASLILAVAVGEAGDPSLTLLRLIDVELADRELPAA